MKIYHGSTFIVEKPNLEALNYKTDFGRGFYTTESFDQAARWTKIKIDRSPKNERPKLKRYVNIYRYTENPELKILSFKEASEEWLKFVYKNRNSLKLTHDYDIVIGPVADDNLYATLRLYERKFLSVEETIKILKTYKLANQISFHTENSLKTLEFLGVEEICDEQ